MQQKQQYKQQKQKKAAKKEKPHKQQQVVHTAAQRASNSSNTVKKHQKYQRKEAKAAQTWKTAAQTGSEKQQDEQRVACRVSRKMDEGILEVEELAGDRVVELRVNELHVVGLIICKLGGIVGGDEGPVGGVAQVVCHGVIVVVGVHGEEGQEEDGEVRGEVKGEVEENQGQPLICMA